MFPYDAQLLAAARTPARTIGDVLQTLRTIEATCADADGLKWFNWLYLAVTQAVAARVGTGGFRDATWLAELDVQFARLYFSALESSLSGQRTPGCWRVLFSRRTEVRLARIQFALAGINAHINHDLPRAIVNTCQLTAAIPTHGGPHYLDYTELNGTLDTLVESAKQTLYVGLVGNALPPLGQLEDIVAAWSVSAARESAWQNAEHLWQFHDLPLLAASFMDMLDGFTTVIGKTLLVPAF